MNKKIFSALNQPFVLWFLSSVVIGVVSWQYTEIQKNSAEKQTQEQALKRANLELKLLLKDIQFGVEQGENITIGHMNITLVKMQYNVLSPSTQFYVPTLLNIMLEIDSRIGSKGLEKYQDRIYEKIKIVSNTLIRLFWVNQDQTTKIWEFLTDKEKNNLEDIRKLASEILSYYSEITDK